MRLILILSLMVLSGGCLDGPSFMKQNDSTNTNDGKDSVEAKVLQELAGAVEGEFSATSGSSQYLNASQQSGIQGAKVSIAPNSLAIDTNITIEEGAQFASGSLLEQLSGSGNLGVTATNNAVLVSASIPMDLAQPMTILIALPPSSSLIENTHSTLIVFYKIFKKSEDKWVSGYLTRDKLEIAGNQVQFESKHFGVFQSIFLNSVPAAPAKEVEVASSALSKNNENKLPAVVWAASIATFNATLRSASVEIKATGHQDIVSCELLGDADQQPPYEIRQKVGAALTAVVPITFERAEALTFRWSCTEKNGRFSQSNWSDPLSIPAKQLPAANPPILSRPAAQVFTTATAAIPVTFVNTGSAAINCSAAPSLPAGLTISPANGTCKISGTPSTPAAAVSYTISAISAANATGTSTITITVNASIPTVSINAVQTSPTNAAAINVTAQFSENVTGFTLSDLIVTNGTAGNLAGSGSTYSFDIVPSDGTVTVNIPGGAAQSSSGIGSTAATPLSIISDRTIPSLTLTATQSSPTNATTINMTAQFSESVTGFTLAGINVVNGSKGNFATVNASTYTFDITGPTGTVTANVPASQATDLAGNGNSSAATVTIVSDSTAPTAVITSNQTSPTNSSTLNMTVQFSETVTLFDISDIVVTNGTKGNFIAVDGDTYTFDITGISGTITANIAAGVAVDAASNNNTAAPQFSIVYDGTAPSVGLSATQPSPTSASVINMTVVFSETVTGFTVGDITVSNGVIANFLAVSGTTYTFNITSPFATVTVNVGANVAQDAAFNTNTASTPFTITHESPAILADITPQTLTVGSAFTTSFTNTGSPVVGCSTSPALPLGFTITVSGNTCEISGNPTNLMAMTSYTISAIAADTSTDTANIEIMIAALGSLNSRGTRRVTFYDSVGSRHWAFFKNAVQIAVSYSADGKNWTSTTPINIDTEGFTVVAKNSKVFLAYENNYDIKLMTGTLATTNISWANDTIVLDGTGPADAFSKPTMTISNSLIYVGAFAANGPNGTFLPKVVASTNSYNSGTIAFGTILTAGIRTTLPTGIALAPYGLFAIVLINAERDEVRSFTYNGSIWEEKSGKGLNWWAFTGQNTFSGAIRAMAMINGDIYVGGAFTAASGPGNGIAKWNGNGWEPLGTGINGTVLSMTTVGIDLYVAGNFTTAGGTSANNIAKWDGSTWSALGTGLNGSAYAVTATTGSNLYVGGTFTDAGGTPANYIAKWNGSGWLALNAGMNGYVFALKIIGSNLFAGGDFTLADGFGGTSRIARWSGSNWYPLGTGVDSTVTALGAIGNDLYVGGDFTTPQTRIAKWDGAAWTALGSGTIGNVKAIHTIGNDLYVGGNLTMAGGIAANKIAKWNGLAWEALEGGVNSIVWAIQSAGADVFVGGDFTSANGQATQNIAKLSTSLVAKAKNTSVTSATTFTYLSYIGAVDGKPYYKTFDGTTWSAPNPIVTESNFNGQVQISVSADNLKILAIWDDTSGNIKTRYYFGSWGPPTTISFGPVGAIPWAPEVIQSINTSVFWSHGPGFVGTASVFTN